MAQQDRPSFQSVAEELEYYKALAQEHEEALKETSDMLEEFQLSSKELEAELENEIESTERRCHEMKIRNESMRQEVDEWKDKYQQSVKDSNAHINQLTRQLEDLKKQTEMFIKKERELEQDNDDLERHERAAKWSLQELEVKYNASVEKTAILEGEVASKVALSEEVQRLKDELRDANVELAVMKSNQAIGGSSAAKSAQKAETSQPAGVQETGDATTTSSRPSIGRSYDAMPSLRARLARNNSLQRSSTRLGAAPVNGTAVEATTTATTSAPQNPVRTVQDMVGRVRSLEARLASCRSLVTPLLQPPPSYSTVNSPTPSSRSSYISSRGTGSAYTTTSRPESPSVYSSASPNSASAHKVVRRTSLLLQQHLQQHRDNLAKEQQLREQRLLRRQQEEEHEREIQQRQLHLQQQNSMTSAPEGILST